MAIDPAKIAAPSASTAAAPAIAEQEQRVLLEEERVYRRGVVSVQDLVAPAAVSVTSSHLELGGMFLRTMFVVGYPRYVSVGWFAPIVNLNKMLDIAMYFYPIKTAIIMKQLKKKVGALEAQLMSDREKGAPRDPIRETALRDIEKLRDDLAQGTEKFFQYALYVTVYAENKEELDKVTDDVENIFGQKLVTSKRVLYQAEQGFASTLPLNDDGLAIAFNMNSSPCASSFPFISSELTSNNGVLYGINRHNNSLILFDRFSLQNANMVVFATSGAGKSVTGETEVLVRDTRGQVRLTSIGDLVESLGAQRGFRSIGDGMEGVVDPGIAVYGFDRKLRGRWSTVTVAARKDAPADLFMFRTNSGRRITTTGDHNMLVLRNGQVVCAKSADVRVGARVPIPAAIPEPEEPTTVLNLLALLGGARVYVDGAQSLIAEHLGNLRSQMIDARYDRYLLAYSRQRPMPMRYFVKVAAVLGDDVVARALPTLRLCSSKRCVGATLPARLPVTGALARLLGYIVSEGHVNDQCVLVSNCDADVLTDTTRCLDALGIRWFQRRDGTVVVSARVWIAFVRAIGAGGHAGVKRVPPFLFNATQAIVAEFLRTYFEGDGGVERHAITACSKSLALCSDLAYLFARFSISARIAERTKRATNSGARGTYGVLTLSGQENLQRFADAVNFVTARKQQALARLLGKRGNTNVDTVPIADLLLEIAALAGPVTRGHQTVNDIIHGVFQPSRTLLARLADELEQRVLRFESLREKLAPLASLPSIEMVVAAGDDRAVNARLWGALGHSWQTMRAGRAPRTQTVLRALPAVGGPSWTMDALKQAIATGFRALDIDARSIAPHLSYALHGHRMQDTEYALLHRAARQVWERYEDITARLPEVCERIARLRGLARAPLWWDSIVAVDRVPNSRSRFVYDLTVDDEVFLAGHGGMFVHNSYAVKVEVLRSLMMGTDVIVIDPEMEYKHLSDAVGGTYVNVSLSADAKVNPFDLPRPLAGEMFSVEDIIRSAVITIKGLLRLMIGPFSTEEDAIIDRALLETYAKRDITPQTDLARLTATDMPIMQDLQQILEGMVGAHALGERLKKYTEGTFATLLNSPTNVQMENRLVVFSVRDLEDELKPIAIYSIVNYIWNVVRSVRKKRVLVVDEAWWLMQREDSAKFIFALVKRCRKYFLGVTTITQDVNDFLTSPYGRAIVTNSALQLLLKQSPAAIEMVQKTFLLTDGEKYLLLEGGPGEGIFFAGSKHVAIKVVASYTEDQLITSDPKQLLEIERAKKEFEEAAAQREAEQEAVRAVVRKATEQ